MASFSKGVAWIKKTIAPPRDRRSSQIRDSAEVFQPEHGTLPSLRDIQHHLWPARTQWFNIGIEFGVDYSTLEAIQKSNAGVDICFRDMLSKVVNSGHQQSWSTICKVLRRPTVGHGCLADEIERASSGETSLVGEDGQSQVIQNLQGRLMQETQVIKIKFSELVRSMEQSMKLKLAVQELVRVILKFPLKNEIQSKQTSSTQDLLFQGRLSELHEAKEVSDVFDIIEPYTSFFNYEIVKFLVSLHGNDQDKSKLQEYEDSFNEYCRRRVVEHDGNLGESCRDDGIIYVRLQKVFEDYTLNATKLFRGKLCKILNVSEYALRIVDVKSGSVTIEFIMPKFALAYIFPLTDAQTADLVKEGVEAYTVGDEECISVEQVVPSETSQLGSVGSIQSLTIQPSQRRYVTRHGKAATFMIRPLSLSVTDLSIPLCEFKNNEIVPNKKALDLLETLTDKPVAIVSICGPYRTGKSYYLSRVLNDDKTFKTDNELEACTSGIWMATHVLEGEDVVIVLLDTEGMGSFQDDRLENNVLNYIVLSTLLSSFLVYNSRGPAQKSDLNTMSYFAHLTQHVLIHKGDKIQDPREKEELQKHFPNFFWLLRDSDFKVPSTSSSLTEYIKTKILNPSGFGNNPRDEVATALLTLFPSLECMQIPHPGTSDPTVVPRDQLNKNFNEEVEKSIVYILSNIEARRGFDNAQQSMDGELLAHLIKHYVSTLNEPDMLLNLERGWQSAVKHKIETLVNKLVQEYESEMHEELEDSKLPIEEGQLLIQSECQTLDQPTLFEIHRKIYGKKFQHLQKEVDIHMPGASFGDESLKILDLFENRIIQTDNNKIKGGVICQFISRNHHLSKEQCSKVFHQEYVKQLTTPLGINILSLQKIYDSIAVGPAKHVVIQEELQAIPNAPTNLKKDEIQSHHVMINWSDPNTGSQYINGYEVELQCNDFPVSENRNVNFGIIKPVKIELLKPNMQYRVRIRAISPSRKGEYSSLFRFCTKAGKPEKPDKPVVNIISSTEGEIIIQRLSKINENGAQVNLVIVESSLQNDTMTKWTRCKEENVKLGDHEKSMSLKLKFPALTLNCKCINYRVIMVNSGGESDPSDVLQLSSTELLPGEPVKPVIHFDDFAAKRSIVVSWDLPNINPCSVQSYEVELQRNNLLWRYREDRNVQEYTLSELVPGATYKVNIRCFNKNGNPGERLTKEFNTPPLKPERPAKPKINVNSKTCSQGTLTIQMLSKDRQNGSPVNYIIIESKATTNEWIRKTHEVTNSDDERTDIKVSVDLDNVTEQDQVYYFRTRMQNSVGISEPSYACDLPTSEMIPGKPLNFQAERTYNSIKLTWQEPNNNPKSVEYYSVKMKKADANDWSQPRHVKKKISRYCDLYPNVNYEFCIRSYNKDNTCLSEPDSTVLARTTAGRPKKPEHSQIKLNVDVNPNEAEISLPRPSEEESGSKVVRLTILLVNKSGGTYKTDRYPVADSNSNVIIQKISIDNETHYTRVQLSNSVGISQPSELVCVSTADIRPGPPVELEVSNVKSNSLTLGWKCPEIQARAAKDYCIEKKVIAVEGSETMDNVRWKQLTTYEYSQNMFEHMAEITDLLPCMRYSFHVYAINGTLKGKVSTEVEARTPAGRPEKPQPPVVCQAKNDLSKLSVTCPKLESGKENGSPINQVIIEYCYDKINWERCGVIEVVHDSQYFSEDIDLPNITERIDVGSFRAKVKNQVDQSEPSDPTTLKMETIQPGRVTRLQVSSVTHHEAKLTWNPPNVHPAIVSEYVIEECQEEGRKMERKMSRLSCTIKRLRSNQAYTYQVSAVSSIQGPPEEVSFTTDILHPQKPENLRIEKIRRDVVKVRWSKPTQGDPEANSGYRVQLCSNDDQRIKSCDKKNGSWSKVFRNLSTYTKYKVKVGGINDRGDVSELAIIEFKTRISKGARAGVTALTSVFGVGLGGLATYMYTKQDEEVEFYSSGDEDQTS